MENISTCGSVPETPAGWHLQRRSLTCPAGNVTGPTEERPSSERESDRGAPRTQRKVLTELLQTASRGRLGGLFGIKEPGLETEKTNRLFSA